MCKKPWWKNKIIIICPIIIGILLVLSLLWFLVIRGIMAYYVPTPFKVTDKYAYLGGDYKEYAGGDLACEYFPESEDLGTYESIDFTFANNWWLSDPFERAGNSFMLDVTYSQEQYEYMIQKNVGMYGLKGKKPSNDHFYEYIVGDIQEYYVYTADISDIGNAIIFRNNIPISNNKINRFEIMFFDNAMTIRYVFIEKRTRSSSCKRELMDLDYFWDISDENLDYLVMKYLDK